jgi:hypothetical protein
MRWAEGRRSDWPGNTVEAASGAGPSNGEGEAMNLTRLGDTGRSTGGDSRDTSSCCAVGGVMDLLNAGPSRDEP